MMKNVTAVFLVFCSASAFATQPTLLETALSCQLKDEQIASLMRDLALQQPAFVKPSQQFGTPSADIYRLPKPVSALGYSSNEVVVTPARVLLAVPAQTVSQAVDKLNLIEEAYSPASREIRPTVSVVAFQLSHKELENKLLVGCQYANNDAAGWIQ
ncbi:hypothetical protein IFU01_20985 [Oxalobacteraceae sp. CFBP 8763]|nr:hypothetical protein [Oxalobacteraceae sp. CFBP 8763]